MFVPFAEWLPDLGENNPGAKEARNVTSLADFYVQFPTLNPTFSALPLRPLGAGTFRGLTRTIESLAATKEKIYRGDLVAQGFSWEEIGTGYNTDEDNFDYWEMAQWQNRVFLTDYTSPIQQYILASGGPVTDLIATIYAKHIAAARDFVLIGNVNDEDGVNPTRVRWCAYRNPDDWVPDVDTQAGFKDLEGDGGQVQRIIGGEIPIILREDAVHRFIYEGGDRIWQNDRFLEGIGTPAPRSAVKAGKDVLFLSNSGFVRLVDGVTPAPIGEEKVDQTFFRLVNTEYLPAVQAVYFPRTKVVIWSFAEGSQTLPSMHFVYNLVTDRWTCIEAEMELFFVGSSPGYTLEDLSLVSPDTGQPDGGVDGLPASLDSRIWLGELGLSLAFDRLNQAGSLDGPPMEALISTGETVLEGSDRFTPKDFRPVIHSDNPYQSMTVWAEHHNVEWQPHKMTAPKPPNTLGLVPLRLSARYQRYFAQFQFGGAFEAKGVSMRPVKGGFR